MMPFGVAFTAAVSPAALKLLPILTLDFIHNHGHSISIVISKDQEYDHVHDHVRES